MKDINRIRRAAHSFSRTTGIDYDTLFSEAAYAYISHLDRYRGQTATKETWLTEVMRHKLCDFVKRYQAPQAGPEDGFDIEDMAAGPEETIMFRSELESLSQEAQFVCKMIFDTPAEFLAHAPTFSRGRVKEKLREMGWQLNLISKVFKEIKGMVGQS